MPHTNPFAKDPRNPYTKFSDIELSGHRNTLAYCVEHPETYADGTRLDESRARFAEATEEMERRGDVDTAVELWERLCAVPFVRGETQGYYTHSTAHLSPVHSDHLRNVYRMPDTAELEALVLSDGEETVYPPHDAQPEYDPSIPDLTPEQRAAVYFHEDKNPWSGDDRLYPITLTLISCGDYHGSDVDAANNRALDGTPGVDVREPNTGGQGSVFNVSTTVVGQMTSFENSQTTADWEREPSERRADALMWLESLVKQMEGLMEYGLLDEGTHSEFVDELAREAWDSWLESDVRGELEAIADKVLEFPYGVTGLGVFDGPDELVDALYAASGERLPVPTSLDGDDAVRVAYFEYEENEWTVSSLSEGATNGRHHEAVAHVARTVFGWNVP